MSPSARALFSLFLGGVGLIQDAMAVPELVYKKNCTSCHGINQKLVGPAFVDVARKYRYDKAASEKLVVKVMQGGVGVWGAYAMPANPQVNADEAKVLVSWVLGLQ